MKISELVAARPALEKIAQIEMDPASALKIAKMTRRVLEEIQKFEVTRAELFTKYGEQQEDGNVVIMPKNAPAFKKAIEKGLNRAVKIMPLALKDIKALIAPADLVNCLKLFK